ncbi:hypothetical protein [Parasphingopyxis marina]|uniref:Membrane protein YqaA, SNARE-associated domain n=1 Tax=Parasphingopyxis marina TaxID=2761622 RepID=A0A842I1F0_9SPHN|nr:hypothetical protein [Parasphingopyxis marina]MBC2778717.1 hypothetical protein [Parasphingopyxis marina]
MIAGFAIVALWAFAEAILWFIVADVPISYLAVRYGWKTATVAALIAALAAVPGGIFLYCWAQHDGAGVAALLEALPAIDAAMIAEAERAYRAEGFAAMLAGSFGGMPYKLYALAAGNAGSPLLGFALASFAARVPRFLIIGIGTAIAGRIAARWLSLRGRLAVLGLSWALFYTWYFATMPG